MMEIKIKKASINDLEKIKDLNQELFEYENSNFDETLNCDWPKENKPYFENAIQNPDYLALVALLEEKIVGYLIGSLKPKEEFRNVGIIAEIENTFISKDYRGIGIGRKLFNEFVKWAKEKGISRIKVVASVNNSDAIKFYKSCGFKEYDMVLEGDI